MTAVDCEPNDVEVQLPESNNRIFPTLLERLRLGEVPAECAQLDVGRHELSHRSTQDDSPRRSEFRVAQMLETDP